jgi:phage terminase large subunit-like protein
VTSSALELAAAEWLKDPDAAWRRWREIARAEQLPPVGAWLLWAFVAGRGSGKTRSAAEWVSEKARAEPGCRIALVGRTPADVRDVMIEGESGILAVTRDGEPPDYQPSKRRLTWPNGSAGYAYSAEVPAQLRGPQHHYAWADEAASWTDARRGDVLDTAWNNLMLGLRLGQSPRCVVTTTPKPNALIRTILARPSTVVTRSTTYRNLANLAPSFRDEVLAAYEGTRIGRQELHGELLEDIEGALWTLAMIDGDRVAVAPEMRRIVVAVDPSGGSGPDNDEQGIVVAGIGVDGDLYVLADRSCRLSPHGWASRAVGAYQEFAADRIVAEGNFGGQMVLSTIQQVSATVPVKIITASRGKVQRAEPVAAAYEQHRVHHVGAMTKLEDQLTTWTPRDGTSPDRLDALCWAITELAGGFGADAWIAWARRKSEQAIAFREARELESAPAMRAPAAADAQDAPLVGVVVDAVSARKLARDAAALAHPEAAVLCRARPEGRALPPVPRY